MNADRRRARLVGVLYIIGTVAGILSLTVTAPVRDAKDMLISLAANENALVAGALIVLTMGVALAMIPVLMFPILRRHNETLALGYVVFRGGLETVTSMATAISWLLLLALGHAYVQAGVPDPSGFQELGTVLLRGEAIESVSQIVFPLGALMFYFMLYQTQLTPRWLSGWGLVAALLWLATSLSVTLGLIGGQMSTIQIVLALPIGVQEMVLAVWLIVKGFSPSAIAALSARTEPS
jgi:hypothetical protein